MGPDQGVYVLTPREHCAPMITDGKRSRALERPTATSRSKLGPWLANECLQRCFRIHSTPREGVEVDRSRSRCRVRRCSESTLSTVDAVTAAVDTCMTAPARLGWASAVAVPPLTTKAEDLMTYRTHTEDSAYWEGWGDAVQETYNAAQYRDRSTRAAYVAGWLAGDSTLSTLSDDCTCGTFECGECSARFDASSVSRTYESFADAQAAALDLCEYCQTFCACVAVMEYVWPWSTAAVYEVRAFESIAMAAATRGAVSIVSYNAARIAEEV